MILGVGTDIARVARFEKAQVRHGERFARRVLGVDELADYRQRGAPPAFLAKRFAAKEAFVKALGTGLRHGMRWTEIQVANDALGRPTLMLVGRARELAEAEGIKKLHLSLSDEAEFAVAFVILEA
jgi:holo-[acyl-carrier protein] synthase